MSEQRRDGCAVAPAHGLGAFRSCRHGDAIAYNATLESSGPEAVELIVSALRRQYYLADHGCCAVGTKFGCYAVLDITDDEGCMLDTICVPDMHAFDHLRHALSLRITSSDCDQGCV
jgi:hypothetical protein